VLDLDTETKGIHPLRINYDAQVLINDYIINNIELLFNKKTPFCKHKSPDCITNAVHGFISNFKIGLKIRIGFTLLQVLLRGVKLNKISIVD
jgi:hypothetical protein